MPSLPSPHIVTIAGSPILSRRGWRFKLGGFTSLITLIFAATTFVLSWFPSVLPRTGIFQLIITVLCVCVGTGAGMAIGFGLDIVTRRRHSRRWWWPEPVGYTLVGVSALAIVSTPVLATSWQRRFSEAVGLPSYSLPSGLAAATAALILSVAVVVLLAHFFRLSRYFSAPLLRWMSHRTAKVVGLMLFLVVGWVAAGLIWSVVLSSGTRYWVATHPQEETWLTAPTVSEKSGSPESFEKWKNLDSQGRSFVAKGASRQDIERVTGRSAKEPIRVYAALNSRSISETASAAVAELLRTDGLSRSYLLIVTTTGAGNVNHWAATSFEYLTGGDCAIIGIQHSTIPSAFQFFDKESTSIEASTELFSQVTEQVNRLPVNARPKIYLHAESIGAYGAQTSFTSVESMLDQVSGALWIGTPGFTKMQASLLQQRVPWVAKALSRVILLDDRWLDDPVQFACGPEEIDTLTRAGARWGDKRILYLSHRSDPVAQWSWTLMVHPGDNPTLVSVGSDKPVDWPRLPWIPVVTWIQHTFDLSGGMATPAGEGHIYRAGEFVPAWVAVLGLDPDADYAPIIDAVSGQHG